MSNAGASDKVDNIAANLPYLRRYARALTGSQQTGDTYAAATLEAILADPETLDAGLMPKTALFRAFHKVWSSAGAPLGDPDTRLSGRAQDHMASLTPNTREALLLHAIEEFGFDEIGTVMEIGADEAGELVSIARREMASSIAGSILVIEDEAIIAMDIETIVTEMGLKLGDEITLNILGRALTFRIANFRKVDFGTMGINFLMIVDPAALAAAPHTHIATVYGTEAAEAPLLRALSAAYPNITAIRVRDAIDRVSETLEGIGAAARWGASVTLVTGLVVLVGAAAAGERRRVYEAAVLKTLGASRARILASFALRAGLAGLAAGLVAIAAGAVAGWWVTVSVMEGEYHFAALPAFGIVAGGALASLAAGLAFALRPLAARPARVPRARE